ncbi:MAG: T9SS type A sorting domain-containing protein [Calditrichaeota bacterium]|nr:T9SS type A sorting domain-containing protein [Calditrichota bacterium]
MSLPKPAAVLVLLGFLSGGIVKATLSAPTTQDTAPAQFVDYGNGTAELTIRVQGLCFEKIERAEVACDSIILAGEPTIGRAGFPDLPFIARTILLPPQTCLRLEVADIRSQTLHNITPALACRESPDGTFERAEIDARFQNLDEFWPPEPITITEPAVLRGHRLATIRFYPVQYNPATGQTRVNDEIDLRVFFDDDPLEPRLPLYPLTGSGGNRPNLDARPKPSIYVQRILEGLVLNPPAPPSRDDVQSGSYLYIIPEVQGLEAEINPLIEWRRRQGHRVNVVRVQNNTVANTIHEAIRAAYNSADPVEFVTLVGDATAGANVLIPAASLTGDYGYTRVDGNDPLPDIALGRISCSTIGQLRTIVNKIVPYESAPNMQETAWYQQGAVVAGHIGNGLGEVLTAIYVRRELLNMGFREVRAWLWPQDGEIGQNDRNQTFISQCFEWGVSCFHYRAYNRMNNLPTNIIPELRNRNGVYPAVLAISCNTGSFVADQESYTEAFLRSQGGGIGAIGTATGNTNVRFNNLVAGGVWSGVYLKQLWCMGWGLNYGKYEIWRAYQGLDEEYLNFMEWNNLMGDPGTHIWSAVPRRITVAHPQNLSLGASRATVVVTDQQTRQPEPNAQVCLWKTNQLHSVLLTDEQGCAEFYIPPNALTAGVLKITVTKHNVQPFLADIQVAQQAQYLGVIDWSLDDDDDGASAGDGDTLANPGETLELRCTLRNYGNQQPQGAITITGQALSPWCEIAGNPIVIQQAPAGGQQTEFVLLVSIDPACPDEAELPLVINVTSGQTVWTSLLKIPVAAPKVALVELQFEGGTFTAGNVKNLNVVLCNIGHKRLNRFSAQLESLHPQVEVLTFAADYRGLNIGQSRPTLDNLFRLRAHPLIVPGTNVTLRLSIESEGGFRDTTTTTITLGQPGNNDPLGPDCYGYLCFDSGDQGWDQTPTYSWIEINPAVNPRQFNGTPLNLTDTGDNDDTSRAVNLPFNFRFYGQQYNRITVCTNGWLAFGDAVEFSDFRNQHIGQALGPRAMLAVWWDNLITVNESAILTYYDRNGGCFIVEWHRLRRLLDGGGAGAWESFQAVLYDPQMHRTPTGDGIILFQYREVTNENARAHNDIPFCTIGIQSPSGVDGLEYTYWNQYPRGARQIASQMALKFTTSNAYRMGCIAGRVTDAADEEPIGGAEIIAGPGFFSATDEDGYFIIEDVRIGNNYNITVWAIGWNDSTRGGINVVEAETTRVNFTLLHPTFDISPVEVNSGVEMDNIRQIRFTLQNRGNGTLVWSVQRRLPPNMEFNPWEIRGTLPIAGLVRDDRIESAVFVNDRYYVAGANVEDSTLVYILDREGNRIGQFEQFGAARYGMKDMDFDGELIWGSGEAMIFGFTPEGELRRAILSRRNPMAGIAWDSDRHLLWACPNTNDLDGYDLEGNLVRTIPRGVLRIYGLAYYPEDPDRKNLYLFCWDSNLERQQLFRVNPDDRQVQFVTYLDPPEGGRSGGAFISNQWDVFNWTLITTTNNPPNLGGDRIYIYELAPRRDWMRIMPESGRLAPDGEQVLALTLDATNLPEAEFTGELLFTHNAAAGRTIIPIALTVREALGEPEVRILRLARGWNTVSLNIAPPDSDVTIIAQPLVDNGLLRMLKDAQGRFYRPQPRFNNIPHWATGRGYLFNITEAAELIVIGHNIAADSPISLSAGWNIAAYLPRQSLPARTAVERILDQLIIVKDGRGRFYLPEYDFANLDFMREGEGYQFKVSEDVQFVYNTNGDNLALAPVESDFPHHFVCSANSGENLSLLLLGEASLKGWEAAVLTNEGIIAGAGVFDAHGRCGFAVFNTNDDDDDDGDNDANANADYNLKIKAQSPKPKNNDDDDNDNSSPRALHLAPFILILWNGAQEIVPSFEPLKGEPRWSKDAVVIGKVSLNAVAPFEFKLGAAYPNPFNRTLRLNYSLPSDGAADIALFDFAGRQLQRKRFDGKTGSHSFVFDTAGLPSGVYLFRLTQNNRSATIKAALIK